MNTEQEEKVTAAFEKWYSDLCKHVPLAVYENKEILFTAFIAGAVYEVEDTNSKLHSLVTHLNTLAKPH